MDKLEAEDIKKKKGSRRVPKQSITHQEIRIQHPAPGNVKRMGIICAFLCAQNNISNIADVISVLHKAGLFMKSFMKQPWILLLL